ncbi:sigma-70 family RNA polymerase sigma factor [Streptomyces sp. M41]|uniref:sigma-70 family RNA polymerase sigma factor n=1 Tax=Streptomyces sp. M41 TaxID=3059412 RepID=UPI00374DC129
MPFSEPEDLASRSDAELTAEVRNSAADAELSELYRRHHAAVWSYARTCCREWHIAEELTAEAFARTIKAVRKGHGPEQAWRPYLLTVVRRIAADWGATARRTDLSPDFENWLSEAAGAEPVETGEERMLRLEESDLVLQAFHSLPERWQGVLWHTLVEGESTAKVGELLGLSASGVASLAARAREGLREAYLAVIAGAGTEGECRHYIGLLAATVRGAGRRSSKSLQRHLSGCERCSRAMADLKRLNEQLPSALSVGVLLWGGTAYAASRACMTEVTASLAAQQTGLATIGPAGPTAKSQAAVFGVGGTAGAIAMAIAIGTTLLGPGDGGKNAEPPPHRPPATVVPSRFTSPPVSPSLSPEHRSRPRESKSAPVKSRRAVQRPSPSTGPTHVPVWAPEADMRTQLRIVPTDACLTIEGGSRSEGARPRQADCDGSTAQLWDLVSVDSENHGHTRLRNVASGLCLTASGSTEDGSLVQQRPCDPSDDSQEWLRCEDPSDAGVNFIDETGEMYLILDDWAEGDGMHEDTFGTSHMYVDSPPFGFRLDH